MKVRELVSLTLSLFSYYRAGVTLQVSPIRPQTCHKFRPSDAKLEAIQSVLGRLLLYYCQAYIAPRSPLS